MTLLKEDSYDRKGNLKKKKSFTYAFIDNYFIANDIMVEDIQKKHTTKVTFSDISVDNNIQGNLFHEKNLRRTPIY
jgi:hypothetical protein